MIKRHLDCIVIGHNEGDLQAQVKNAETTKDISGLYRYYLEHYVYFRQEWLSGIDLLNNLLTEASGKKYHLNQMKLPHLGVCYLTSFLTRRNCDVAMINYYNDEKKRLVSLLQAGPRCVAITTTFYLDSTPIKEIVKFIRRFNTQTKIIVGGPHIFNLCNANDIDSVNYCLEEIGADIYIYDAQGERTLSLVVNELKTGEGKALSAIPNLIYRRKEQSFTRTERRIECNDLDENPIDWSLLPKELYTPTVMLRTSRGCAFACSFCTYHIFGRSLSLAGVKTVEQEMKKLHSAGVKNIIFVDDTFNIPLAKFKEILKMMIANKFEFSWFSYFRCSNADHESFDLMKKSGCKMVFLGIESGDETILKNMNKKVSLERYKQGISGLQARDIDCRAMFITGFPGETEESVRKTIDFIEETRPTYYHSTLFSYNHNAPIHKQAAKFGLEGSGWTWRHNTMDWEKACAMIDMIYNTVTGSTICKRGWNVAYLYGKGMSLESIKKYHQLLQPLLLKNLSSTSPAGISDRDHEHLLAFAKKTAEKIEPGS